MVLKRIVFRKMKINILLLLCLFIIKNIIDQTVSVKIKSPKGFDEIFGEGWEKNAHENELDQTDQNGIIGQNVNRKNTNNVENIGQKLFIEQFDQIFVENFEMKNEESEEMSTNDGDELEQMSANSGQISDHFSSEIDKKKREIVEKFEKIKEKIKQIGKKYPRKEWNKIERKIAQKLDVSQEKIYEWKREFGMMIHKNSEDEKRQILIQFDQIYDKLKMKLNEKLEGKRMKCKKIIAKHLGINIRSIYYWKKQLKIDNSLKNQKTVDEIREIVEKYLKKKSAFKQNGKHSRKEWKEFQAKIKPMFGMHYLTIERWAKKLKINQNASKERKFYTNAEKMEIMKTYYQMKEQNPKFTDPEIAAILKIAVPTLRKCKSDLKKMERNFKL